MCVAARLIAVKKRKIPAAVMHRVMVELGRRGGKARAKKQSKRKLSEIGQKAARARWKKARKR
jgi:hypothetical protein